MFKCAEGGCEYCTHTQECPAVDIPNEGVDIELEPKCNTTLCPHYNECSREESDCMMLEPNCSYDAEIQAFCDDECLKCIHKSTCPAYCQF